MNKFFTTFTFLMLCLVLQVSAQTYTSVQSGDWDDPATWDCSCVPPTTAGADITIILAKDHVVTIDQIIDFTNNNKTTRNVELRIYGTLEFTEGPGGNKGRLDLTASSIIQIASGGKIVTDGSDNVWITMGGSSSKLQGDNLDGIEGPRTLDKDNLNSGGAPVSTLPVDLLYFRSQNNAQGIQLEWASSKEWNFSHYTVERSENGRDFTAIHEEYVGESENYDLQTYQFLDRSPLYGANYYRLKTTDVDGTIEYKGITLAYAGMTGQLRVSPNPAKGNLITIHYPGATAEGSWLSIMSASGHEMMKIQMTEKELRLPAAALAPGIYIITVSNQLETKQQRLIVQ